MEIVINISEECYKPIEQENEVGLNLTNPIDALIASVKHGTPLPKGHGRLIDADAFIDNYEECGWIDDIKVNEFNAITPTIIEADKESD